mmetsp:Transcript_14478/g.36366  ORF Transcript_14478/g.36366 Transcript_14478/m.36366 type:complete len:343 (-) Transcript_14478:106-1134(-)
MATKTKKNHNVDDCNHSIDTTVITEADIFDMSENSYCNKSGEELVWYFSYGSNMNPAVFEKKRKIKCRDHKVCKVPGYVLTYTHGVMPFVEPAFCTCVERSTIEDDRPDIHGVAFLITRKQYEHMLLTEGGWGYQEYRNDSLWTVGHYGEEEVECHEIQPEGCNNEICSKPFKALTLVGLLGVLNRYDANASKRYHDLVNVGAESSGLPASYREYLKEKHPPYKPTGCRMATFAKYVFMAVSMPILILEIGSVMLCSRWNARKMEERESQQNHSQHPADPTRRKFDDVVRPPWIIMKFCFFYRTLVMEVMATTLLFDVCKFPNGYRNKTNTEATDATAKKSL